MNMPSSFDKTAAASRLISFTAAIVYNLQWLCLSGSSKVILAQTICINTVSQSHNLSLRGLNAMAIAIKKIPNVIMNQNDFSQLRILTF